MITMEWLNKLVQYLWNVNMVIHASNLSDIFGLDDHTTFLYDVGERGIIQILSMLPTSYPGHSLLQKMKEFFGRR